MRRSDERVRGPVIAFFELGSTWDQEALITIRSHYTGSAGPPPGKKAMWRILERGRLRGYIGLGEPAYKLAPRRRLGLTDARPLPQTVCCFIFRVDPGEALASAILRAWHPIAGACWAQRYGVIPVHWETMVDPEQITSSVPGACFRRAGYRSLGLTTGWSARRPKGHGRGSPRQWFESSPKLVLYRGPLARLGAAST